MRDHHGVSVTRAGTGVGIQRSVRREALKQITYFTWLCLLCIGAGAATVSTDKLDYMPGSTVQITGTGWQPGETVRLYLTENPVVSPQGYTWDVIADAAGSFLDQTFHVTTNHLGVAFTLQATGLMSGFAATTMFTDAVMVNLDQGRNGTPSSPDDPVDWVNMALNAVQAHFVEGYSVPYRVVITGLSTGSHTLEIGWDITATGGKHAIDYITHYDRLEPHNQFGSGHTTAETVIPTNGVSGIVSGPFTFPIPAPSSAGSPTPGQPTTSFNSLPLNERELTIWNGVITSAVYTAEGNLAAANSESSMEIKFVTTNDTVVIAWGGHIASKEDWGAGNSASDIMGSPYHMRIEDLDGQGGNQERALAAGAVRSPPTCEITGPTNICAGTTNAYSVSTDFGTNFVWTLTNNTSGAFFVSATNQTNVNVAAGATGTYTIQVLVSSNALSSVCTQMVIVQAGTTSVGPTNVTLCSSNNATFSTTPAGTGPFTFIWRKDGTVIVGATNSSYTVTNALSGNAGTYCVEVTGFCNSVTNCATLTVNLAPAITCPSNTTVQCYADVPPPNTNSVLLSGGPATVTHEGDTAVTNGCQIVITRTYMATNECGSATCMQTITVEDAMPPSITCPSNIVVMHLTNVPPCPGTLAGFLAAGGIVSDNCDTNLTYSCSDGPLIGGPCGGTITRTHTVIDDCNNTNSCTQTIVISDQTGPMITCPSNITVQCTTDVPPCATNLMQFLTQGGMVDDTNVTYQCMDSPLTNSVCGGTIMRTHTVIDACTNSSSCIQIITINDTNPPSITCPTNIIVQSLQEVPPCPGSLEAFLAAGGTVSDNCSTNLTYQCSDGPFVPSECGGTITRMHTVVDDCGNTNSCTQIITIGGSLTVTHETGPCYTPGGTLCITNVFTYSGELTSLVLHPELPLGWVIVSVSGDGDPDLERGDLVWDDDGIPPSPITAVYCVAIPEEECGPRAIRGKAKFILCGPNMTTNYAQPDPLVLSSCVPCCNDLSEAVDTPSWPWKLAGDAPWRCQTIVSHDGMDAAQSGAIDHGENTRLELFVTGPGTISFWWKVSSETNNDQLRFYIGTQELVRISGEVDWQFKSFNVPAGTQLLKWRYSKNGSKTKGQDAAWVDEIQFTPSYVPVAPLILTQPVSQTAGEGSVATLQVSASGSLPFTHQWYFNNMPLVNGNGIFGATTPTLTLSNFQSAMEGNYYVVLSNASGSDTSSVVTVTMLSLADAIDWPFAGLFAGGNASWFAQTAITHAGTDAAQSGAITHGQNTRLEMYVQGPGTISFWWKVSSEQKDDQLRFYVGNVERARISGEVNWKFKKFNVPSGTQLIKWRYSKNGDESDGLDAGWVDQVQFAPGALLRPDGPTTSISTRITMEGERMILRWNITPGRRYEVLYADGFAETEWQLWDGVINLNGTEAMIEELSERPAQRFYRIIESEVFE